METFNLEKWNQDRMRTEQAIKALKNILRESHQPQRYDWKGYTINGIRVTFCNTEYDLKLLRREATALYAVRAHQRGRVHRKTDTWESQNELIGAPGCTPETHRKAA